MTLSDLPALNACLNFTSAVLLSIGLYQIKQGKQEAHKRSMIAAFCASTLFLAGYLFYHFYRYYHDHVGETKFLNPAWFHPYYLTLLVSHLLLAFAILPLVFVTLFFAAKGRFESHKKIARWTWPIWMYVSVTGVMIYLILYQIFPQVPH
jgi:putative membrane protein